ncbi:MAG TPA: hypothetical protein VMU16_00610 [Candidatus Binataceae bacterium]|nr:hypothetical protein [Candidatus Binataceae bacterium]
MSEVQSIPLVLPKPPRVAPGSSQFRYRWQLLDKWFPDLIQALQKVLGIINTDFLAINTDYDAAAGPFPIVVGGTPVVLATVTVILNNITQLVQLSACVQLTTDAGNDPVIFQIKRGSTVVASDYLPPVGGGQSVGKTLVGIDSNLVLGQYTYTLVAQTGGGAGNTDVTAASMGVIVN